MRRFLFAFLALLLPLSAAFPQEAADPRLLEGPGQDLYREAYESMRTRAAAVRSACIKIHVAFKFWNPNAMTPGTNDKSFTYRWIVDEGAWRLEREFEDGAWKSVAKGDPARWELNWKAGQPHQGRFAAGRNPVEEILLPPPPGAIKVGSFQRNPADDTAAVFGTWSLGGHPAFSQAFTLQIDGTGPLLLTGSIIPSWDPDLVGQYTVQWTREKPGP